VQPFSTNQPVYQCQPTPDKMLFCERFRTHTHTTRRLPLFLSYFSYSCFPRFFPPFFFSGSVSKLKRIICIRFGSCGLSNDTRLCHPIHPSICPNTSS
jgi:hypothetical protein